MYILVNLVKCNVMILSHAKSLITGAGVWKVIWNAPNTFVERIRI